MARTNRQGKTDKSSVKGIAQRGRNPRSYMVVPTSPSSAKEAEQQAFGMSQQVLHEGLEPERAHVLSLGWFRAGLKAMDLQIQDARHALARDRFEHDRLDPA